MAEMATMASQGVDFWRTRTNKMAAIFNIPQVNYSVGSSHMILKTGRGCFDRYWLVKLTRTGVDNEQHNKMLTYNSFKASFSTEPYIPLVQNCNQRCDLTRLYVSAQRLCVETQR